MVNNISSLYEVYLETGIISTDTRSLAPGSIFFALKGDRFDGNKFAGLSLENGCKLAVVDDERLKDKPGCFWVPDVLQTLQKLAGYHRQKLRIPVIGITGSNGKTTTKELIAAVLGKKYKVWFTQGNLNNHIGVPLTLLAIPPGTQIAIVEMGANHIGEIADLCKIALPNHGLITNVGKAHLEGFGSFEGVKKGKGELYEFLQKEGGEIFVNVGNPHLLEMVGNYPWIGYGVGDEAVVSATNVSSHPLLSLKLNTSRVSGYPINTCLTGLYNLDNVLAAASVGHYFGIEEELVKEAVESYVPENNRSQFYNTGRNQVLLDAYNANPSSMQVALKNFDSIPHNNKILVLGSMKEMGSQSLTEHRELIKEVLKIDFNACFLTGIEFKDVLPDDPRFDWYEDTQSLKKAIETEKFKDALVLIKGSRANRLELIAGAL
ncbi:UDP-N-acetylmuramoyl-tripeptide--D-alanyl-D-alanine ligase [Marinilabilia rubra]|uniref:UDP-N-acetylmuramoyl-tripeptide--D-alanyl-D-alanine ligase n=1 Tax=Marinilabilia rubra TaxID=2162893 RepID=A0A2U2BA39_9BACT|nr:UDP-N-acetylmuramoyl-tripeptide--D-alanyl-D-alanine ligase [Marinilabilia rubra]PWD99903.1 UDP-N-acetylmuramoyl-tripeptide--D-alanyl-D-alanine ligase [Marinilabilia rubra]